MRGFSLVFTLVLTVHALLLLLTYRVGVGEQESRPNKSVQKELTVIKIKKFERVVPENLRQIVDSEDPEKFETPKETKFLSDKNRRFDRETVARRIAPFQKTRRGERALKKISLSDLGQTTHPLMKAAQAYRAREASDSVSATSDFIEDVPLGDLTYLNTQEFKYYGFYHRIKQKLEQFWGRSIHETAEKLYKQGRRLASDEQVITSLRVTLDEAGEIVAITVIGPSGVSELDASAIQAFNQAGPFSNPPKGMIQEGKVVLEWGFVVQT